MFNINKLPAILSILFTLIIGFIEIINKDSFKIMAFKMLFTAIIFYIIGVLIRKLIVSAIGDMINNKIAELNGDKEDSKE